MKNFCTPPLTRAAGHFRYFCFNNKKWYFCIFYQVNNLFLHQSYLQKPTPSQINLIKNATNPFLLLRKFKNTSSAQLCNGTHPPPCRWSPWPRSRTRRRRTPPPPPPPPPPCSSPPPPSPPPHPRVHRRFQWLSWRNEMRWDEMRWNEMRWDEMGWDEMRWDEMRWDEMRWDEMR